MVNQNNDCFDCGIATVSGRAVPWHRVNWTIFHNLSDCVKPINTIYMSFSARSKCTFEFGNAFKLRAHNISKWIVTIDYDTELKIRNLKNLSIPYFRGNENLRVRWVFRYIINQQGRLQCCLAYCHILQSWWISLSQIQLTISQIHP